MHIKILLILLLPVTCLAQGVTKYGQSTVSSDVFIDVNGKIGSSPKLTLNGNVIIGLTEVHTSEAVWESEVSPNGYVYYCSTPLIVVGSTMYRTNNVADPMTATGGGGDRLWFVWNNEGTDHSVYVDPDTGIVTYMYP